VVVEYLLRSLPECRVVVVGIQPESVRFGDQPTARVADAAERVVEAISRAVAGTG
jgi:hypothetical protein